MAEQAQVDPAQIQQLIAEALQQGIPREEIVNGLSKDLQISPEEAEQLIAAVEQQMGGQCEGQPQGSQRGPRDGSGPGNPENEGGGEGQPQGGGQGQPTGEPKLDGMSLEEAISKLEGIIEPEALIQVLEIILSLSPDDIDRLGEAIGGAGQEQAQAEAAPANEDQMMI